MILKYLMVLKTLFICLLLLELLYHYNQKIAPKIQKLDLRGYFIGIYQGLLGNNGPSDYNCKLILTILNLYNYVKGREKNLGPVFLI